MIEGIRIDVPGAEVKELFERKQRYHIERIETYKAELARQQLLAEEETTDKEDSKFGSSRRDPIADTKAKIEEHASGAVLATFLASHVVTSETYRLAESDLHRLGIRGARQY